jgi:hydrogenase-4 component E
MMTAWIDASCIFVVFLALNILAAYRISAMIQIFALQSFVLSIVPFFLHADAISGRDIVISLSAIILKTLITPAILSWAIRHVSIRSEVRPFLGVGTSIVCGIFLIAGAFWVASRLQLPNINSTLVIPCSLATVLLGFMIMVTRTRAVTQVIGYLVLENGIFLFALSLFDAMPILIELGILLDVFVAVFIMAIVVHHINEEFESKPGAGHRTKMGEIGEVY